LKLLLGRIFLGHPELPDAEQPPPNLLKGASTTTREDEKI
jgi:hypothetical protein